MSASGVNRDETRLEATSAMDAANRPRLQGHGGQCRRVMLEVEGSVVKVEQRRVDGAARETEKVNCCEAVAKRFLRVYNDKRETVR